MSELNELVLKIVSNGKGILAADESNSTMTKRLEDINIISLFFVIFLIFL